MRDGWKTTHCLPKNEWNCKPNPNSLPDTSQWLLSLLLVASYFSVFLWLLIFWWLLYYDIFISNMYVHFHHRFFIAHVLFNVGVFVICMLPLPYSPNYSFYLFYFAIFLQDHCHVAFNPTSIFDRSKLYPTLIYSNCPSLWQNELYKVHDQAWCVHIT